MSDMNSPLYIGEAEFATDQITPDRISLAIHRNCLTTSGEVLVLRI
jgi:hypothetical protein